MREIFELNGGYYLAAGPNATRYESYKMMSSLYRIAALLGWIRALRSELLLLGNPESAGQNNRLREAVNAIENTLAEGGNVETKRVDLLNDIWKLELESLQDYTDARGDLGRSVDRSLKTMLHEDNVNLASELSDERRLRLASEIAEVVRSKTRREVTDALVMATQVQVVSALSIRECWIYRDWQSGIGDLMLESRSRGERIFDIIGYREFERRCLEGTNEEKRWLRRLFGLLDGLDVYDDPRIDARIEQLRRTHVAIVDLLFNYVPDDASPTPLRPKTVEAIRSSRATFGTLEELKGRS